MNFDKDFIQTLLLSLKLATYTTIILLPIGIALGYYLAFTSHRLKLLIETIIWMPLVLPPTVLGFYLLIAFSPNYFFGAFLEKHFHIRLVFSFPGIVIGSVIFSLPFMVNPIKNALASLPPSLKEASYTLGKGRIFTLFFVLLPNSISSILLAIITTFAHTIGEFGVVLMLGGDIKGVSRVASIAIYTQAEMLNYSTAHHYALILTITSFALLFIVIFIHHKFQNRGIL
ncbi:molybdate ABC transporter permease subunit [Helicobacter mustelae]|uniref:Molybdenum transport system permease n=1 Tax=Helicobacter mustelae (strain ATCC 43772 / CCUG 25715 / CIP 103759 / LMG 18044 / NCTC 12198 / R85-136P) TaxID=679897 RepID=D3UJ70_HELM1|nr:molybdate ABC transporter permease subunit [Helicobacter mustelae]CBG40545.1 putative molybdenum transport system permease protein [Helicobacter mustelae 12198]SQH72043.1 molybdenum transport system permease [Helicobacter mustelae]